MKTNRQLKAKRNLIDLHNFKNIDFFEYKGIIYLNCKDSVMISATDIWENLELERKESYEQRAV